MSQLTLSKVVLGLNADPTRNFLLDTDGNGGLRVRRNADGSGGNILTFGADGRRNSWQSGEVIQTQTYQDTGGTSTSTGAYSNVTASFKNFTPRSSNSKLIVECFFNMNVTIVSAANTFAYAVLYNNTAGSSFGTNPTFNVSNSSGGNAMFTSGVCAGVVTNTALTTLQFALRAQVSNTGQSAIVTDHFWKITEVQN